jgi:hypothetical protein
MHERELPQPASLRRMRTPTWEDLARAELEQRRREAMASHRRPAAPSKAAAGADRPAGSATARPAGGADAAAHSHQGQQQGPLQDGLQLQQQGQGGQGALQPAQGEADAAGSSAGQAQPQPQPQHQQCSRASGSVGRASGANLPPQHPEHLQAAHRRSGHHTPRQRQQRPGSSAQAQGEGLAQREPLQDSGAGDDFLQLLGAKLAKSGKRDLAEELNEALSKGQQEGGRRRRLHSRAMPWERTGSGGGEQPSGGAAQQQPSRKHTWRAAVLAVKVGRRSVALCVCCAWAAGTDGSRPPSKVPPQVLAVGGAPVPAHQPHAPHAPAAMHADGQGPLPRGAGAPGAAGRC